MAPQLECSYARRSRSGERVEHKVTRIRCRTEATSNKRGGFLRRMLPVLLFLHRRSVEAPHVLHLFPTVLLLHHVVVKLVSILPALPGFGGPEQNLCRVREAPAAEIRGRRGLLPNDVIEDAEAQLLHRHADTQVDVQRAADPNRTGRLEDPVAGGKPRTIEFVVEVNASATVPFALVDLHHLASDAGNTVVGEKVRRVGPDAIDAVGRQLRHEFQRVATKEA